MNASNRNASNPERLSPKQLENRKEIRAKGRRRFIFYKGVLAFGGLGFVLNMLWESYDTFGWHIPALTPQAFLDVSLELIVWAAIGYWWGAWMWKRFYASPAARD